VVRGDYRSLFDKIFIIDSRFAYEYKGGHIRSALNITNTDELEKMFMKDDGLVAIGERVCIIFHCEFSSQRGPKMYRFLRSVDRRLHSHCYPALTYPEIYLLEGGYKQFFAEHKDFCVPQNYVMMRDPKYCLQLRRSMAIHRQSMQKTRSRSYGELDFSHRRSSIGAKDSDFKPKERTEHTRSDILLSRSQSDLSGQLKFE